MFPEKNIMFTEALTSYREATQKIYMEYPPEGMISEDIRCMTGDDLLDMGYFLNEDAPFDDDFGEEGCYIF